MSRRRKLPKKVSKRIFSATANEVKPINLKATPMRGGFRL